MKLNKQVPKSLRAQNGGKKGDKKARSTRIDWARAKKLYLARAIERKREHKPNYTYTDLSNELLCGVQTVRNYAAKDKWADELSAIIDKGIEFLEHSKNEIVAETAASIRGMATNEEFQARTTHRQLGKLLQQKGIARISLIKSEELSVHEAIKLTQIGVEMERTALGLHSTKIGEAPLPEDKEKQNKVIPSPESMGGAIDRVLANLRELSEDIVEEGSIVGED